jgi:hypothetical protein
MSPYSSNTSSSNPDIQQQYAQQQAEQQRAAEKPPVGRSPEKAPRMVQSNRQQQDAVRDASRVKQSEQLAAIPVAEEGPGGFFIPWRTSYDGNPKWDGSLTGYERKLMIWDFAGELSRLSGSDSSGEADPDSGYEPDPEDDLSEVADASSSAAESGGDDSSSDRGNRDVAARRTDLLPLLFKQVVSSSRGRGECADEFGASDEDSEDSLYAGDAGSGSEPVSEDEGDSGDASDQGSISSAGETDDESSSAASADVSDNESGGTGDSGTNENHLDEFNSSNQCLTLKAGKRDSKPRSDAEPDGGEHNAALAFAHSPKGSQQLSRSRQFGPWDSARQALDALSDSEDVFSDSEGNADVPFGLAPFSGKGSDSFGGQADSFDALQNLLYLSMSEESFPLGDAYLSSVGYSETTEQSSTDPEDDLGPELRADILEDIAEANRKAKEDSDLQDAEDKKRALRSFEGKGFSVSVDLPSYGHGRMLLNFQGELKEKYFQPLAEAVQEKLVLSRSLTITIKDQGGCASASEFIRRSPQSLLDSIPELGFSLVQDPAFFLDAHSLGKLLPAIRALSVPSSVMPTLLERCGEPMARLSKLELSLHGSYCPSTGEWLAQHSDLKELWISNWTFRPEADLVAFAVKPLLLALKRNTSVERLTLSLNVDANKEAIVGLIENNAGIRRLSLLHNFLYGQAGAAIIQSLHLRPRLDELKVHFAGWEVWTALASLIASPSCPREVTLNVKSYIDKFDTMQIISALAENRNLEVLNLKSHVFSREAVPSFVKMVESHPTLKGIRMPSTRVFSRDDVEKIKRALERNRGISVAAPAATAALQVLAGRNYPPKIIHQLIDQISRLSPHGKEDVLQTLVNLRAAVLQAGPRS